jgi:hypothetical protein
VETKIIKKMKKREKLLCIAKCRVLKNMDGVVEVNRNQVKLNYGRMEANCGPSKISLNSSILAAGSGP